ncbi:MAG: segregation/condensation protein A [Chloroflexi bacterium]|nr:segregation/condensation protein A [Chloroflexota bacterium]
MTEYRVNLDVYEGPLDLLLRLIEQEQLDITKVSLVLVTDQYLAHIAQMTEVSAANLADFVVLAARLLVIKSRALLPRPVTTSDEEEEEDPGELLARQLLEYKRFKQVAAALRGLEEQGRREYARIAAPPQIETRLKPGDVTVDELAAAFRRALESHPPSAPADQVIAPVTVHIVDCIQDLQRAVRRSPHVRLSTILRRARSRLEVIVYFLALLEMIKQQRVRAIQERPLAEIYVEAREPDPEAEIQPMDLSEYGEGAQEANPAQPAAPATGAAPA